MTKLGMIGASLFSFVLVGPATAAASDSGYAANPNYHRYDARMLHDAAGPGFGTASPYDPWGLGPYDDGNYMHNRHEWMRLPPSAHGG